MSRISQSLPTVKCSNCAQLVPLSSLADHICHKLSPSKAILAKLRRPSVTTPSPQPQPQQRSPSTPSSPSIPPRASPSPSLLIPPAINHQSSSAVYSRPSIPSLSSLPPQIRSHTPEPDTKTGGEAGMAGVGRRGFQAAVQAAMFASHTQNAVHLHIPSSPSGFDGRRPNPPGYLNIDPNSLVNARDKGPLSASSLSSSTPRTPSPATTTILYSTPLTSSSPTSIKPSYSDKFSHNLSPLKTLPLQSNLDSLISPPPTSDGSGSGLAYDDDDDSALSSPPPPLKHSNRNTSRDKNTHQFPLLDEKPTPRPPPSRSASTSSSYSVTSSHSTVKSPGGYTRALETLYENRTSSPTSASANTNRNHEDPIPIPAVPIVPRAPALSANAIAANINGDRSAGKLLPVRSRTTPEMSISSSSYSRQINSNIDVNVNVNVTDAEVSNDPQSNSSANSNANSNSNVTPIPIIQNLKPKPKPKPKHKPRECTRCHKKILDGRWVQADIGAGGDNNANVGANAGAGAGVLCEMCWKGMYLPKCRRCNLPIEKQAVSSSDGQLKGKYHRECFNCHTCHESFPDKEFYVFDGRPFCRYHYHEVNNSLCGRGGVQVQVQVQVQIGGDKDKDKDKDKEEINKRGCGQPIEGPCAVTHSGARYHPEHLVCEFDRAEYGNDNDDDDDNDYHTDSDSDSDDDGDIVIDFNTDGSGSEKMREGGRGKCRRRLDEYWEIEGRMLCERHARVVEERGGVRRGDVDLDLDLDLGLSLDLSLEEMEGLGLDRLNLRLGRRGGGGGVGGGGLDARSGGRGGRGAGGGLLLPNSDAREARAQKRVTTYIDLR